MCTPIKTQINFFFTYEVNRWPAFYVNITCALLLKLKLHFYDNNENINKSTLLYHVEYNISFVANVMVVLAF